MLSPLYGECHTSGERLQPVTQISLCQISVGKSVCNGFPERLGFRTSLEITFWAIPKQSHSRISPSMLTTKRSSPSSSADVPSERLGSSRFGTSRLRDFHFITFRPADISVWLNASRERLLRAPRRLRLRLRCQREKHHRLTSFDPFPRHSRPDRPSIIPGPIEALIHSVRISSAHRHQSTKKGNSVPP